MPLIRLLCAALLVASSAVACRDGGPSGGPSSGGTNGGTNGGGDGGGGGDGTGPTTPGWTVLVREDFEGGALPSAAFASDRVPADGPFSDGGAFFEGVTPPAAFRATQRFGQDGWLTVESYSRRATASLAEHAAVLDDPAGGANHVLRLRSPQHTDGTVVRPTEPLPARYRVSLRVGFPSFGDGKPGPNGYDAGTETAEPWWPAEDATSQNGFYWLTILDAQPRPHNNTWIHHHRKIVVDSDNHHPPWMEIWNGSAFVASGEHPIMVIALDGTKTPDPKTGLPFLSYANGAWQQSGAIRAVDAYLPGTWYRVTIERAPSTASSGPSYAIEISGRFASRPDEDRTYRATVDASAACVWHYPVDAAEAAGAQGCANAALFYGEPLWPAGGSWPEWFMFGDPHVNYYEGEVFYDDVVLEVWRE
jgi:hypothetical protein